MRHVSRLAVLFVLALAVFGCGGDSGTDPGDTTPDTTLTLGLDPSSALPGEVVAVSGVPAGQDLDGWRARIVDETTEEETFAFVGRDAEGDVFLVVPLRPGGWDATGGVTVTLVDDDVRSTEAPLAIEALPAAATTLQEHVVRLQSLVEDWTAWHGTSREALRAMDAASVPTRLLPLWIAHHLLDDPTNENSLAALLDGSAPLLDGETLDLALLDRLLTTTDGARFFDEGDAFFAEARGRRPHWADAPELARRACIEGGDYGITSAEDLDLAMRAARFAMRRLDGASGQYTQDLARFVSIVGTVPQLKGLATVAGAMLTVYHLVNQSASAVLPSSFLDDATAFDLRPADRFYEEDDDGSWVFFRVTATSVGWKMDQFILESLATIGGMSAFGGFATITEGLGELATNLTEFAIGDVVAAAIQAASGGANIVEICPGVWPNIDVSDPMWSESSVPFGSSIAHTGHTSFDVEEPGASTLKLQTREGLFGETQTSSDVQVVVETIVVDVSPASVLLEPGQTQSFNVNVRNAYDQTVEWELPAGVEEISSTPDGTALTVKVPDEPWASPLVLVARSQAATGSRAGRVDSDPREGGAVIGLAVEEIRIRPSSECIGNGETLQFTAEVTGIEDPEVRWSVAEGYGQIDAQTGLYRAPSAGSTEDLIKAVVVGREDEVFDYAYVQVGACECYFTLTVGGDSSWAGGNSAVTYSVFAPSEENGAGLLQFLFIMPLGPGAGNESFSVSITGTEEDRLPEPGDLGSYEAGAVWVDASGTNSWATFQGDPDAPFSIQIDEFSSTHMAGTMSGTLVQRSDPEDATRITSRVNVGVSFRAGYYAFGGEFPCE